MEEAPHHNPAYDFGVFAEEMAANEYIRRGYTVLERRWRCHKIEIDLILQKEDVVVIAEVKARKSSHEEAMEAVTREKRRRMIRAADVFIRKLTGDYSYRFDIVSCVGSPENFELQIVEDAFLATDLF